jgi:hypothetical protein
VTGTVTTDGNTGTLASADILNWNLVFNDGSAVGPFNSGNSGVSVSGTALSATATQLLFNYTGSLGYLLFQAPIIGSSINYWCNDATSNGQCDSVPVSEVVGRSKGTEQTAARTGTVVLGTAASSVPEPTTISLLLSGGAWLVLLRRTCRL